MNWNEATAELPLIAILRGIEPKDALQIGIALVSTGFRILEVTLNSPEPLESIAILSRGLAGQAVIGAGTVLSSDAVEEVARCGGTLIISPNTNPEVIRKTKALGLTSLPAFSTPTEALIALDWGADALKLFPAENSSPRGLAACLAILPKSAKVFPVGGIETGSLKAFREAGAFGFGIGSGLYKAGRTAEEVATRAAEYVSIWQA